MPRLATIRGLSYQFPSGLATLHLEEPDGSTPSVYVEAGAGLRALASCYGATEGSGDLLEKIVGQEIVYDTDSMGVLEAFTPKDRWDEMGLETEN